MSKENFQYWKELVGLENTDFPHLVPLAEEEKEIVKAVIVPTRLSPIRDAVAAQPQVAVQVQPGWGATTLFRYLCHEFNNDSLTLLVRLDFEREPLDEELTQDDLEFQIKWRMAEAICRLFQDKSRQPVYMYEVTGFEDTGATPWPKHLHSLLTRLEACREKQPEFYRLFPFFADRPLDVCVNYFLSNFQIRTVFAYLFPRKVGEDAMYAFVGAVKNLFDGKDIHPVAMRELYLCTPGVYRQLSGLYERPYRTISYARYSVAEIFRMLISVYKPADDSQSISDIFSERFITAAYDERSTLKRIMERVEGEIVDSLTGDTAQIPYKLGGEKSTEE